MNPNLFKMLFSGPLNQIARKIWVAKPKSSQKLDVGIIDPDDVHKILTDTWENYFSNVLRLPTHRGIRIRLIMNFACLTLSAHQALVHFGIEKDYAIELIHEMIWYVTAGGVRFANRLTKPIIQNQMRRMEILVDLVMKVVFCQPAYQIKKGELEGGFFMDVRTCPVADYMISSHSSDLCIGTWCAVDFGLVEIIGGRLERSGTLSIGKERCDFRFFGAS